jgi:hypothetical protein
LIGSTKAKAPDTAHCIRVVVATLPVRVLTGSEIMISLLPSGIIKHTASTCLLVPGDSKSTRRPRDFILFFRIPLLSVLTVVFPIPCKLNNTVGEFINQIRKHCTTDDLPELTMAVSRICEPSAFSP